MAAGTPAAAVPALGLIDGLGRLARSTDAFRRLYGRLGRRGEPHVEIERVVRGELERCSVSLEETTFEVEAVVDRDGGRHALLTSAFSCADANALLAEPLDESPAIVWVKDLDGRYVRVNRRYTDHLGVTEDQIRGRTDADLSPNETIDGSRLLHGTAQTNEPLALEYVIAPSSGRPALTVLRFPIRSLDGDPIAVCSVAATRGQSAVARSECARLMQIERWSLLDLVDVRAELLTEWGIVAETGGPTPEPEATPENRAHDPALRTAIAERDAAVAANASLEQDLGEGRRRIAALHEASATAARRAHELVTELANERSRGDQLEHELTDARARVTELELCQPEIDTVEQERGRAAEAGAENRRLSAENRRLSAELERLNAWIEGLKVEMQSARLELEASHRALEVAIAERAEAAAVVVDEPDVALPEPEVALPEPEVALPEPHVALPEPAAVGTVPQWTTVAQRSLTATLAGASEWRTGLKDALRILGTAGGWDSVCAWFPDDHAPLVRCGAMWTAVADQLDKFETSTWQRPEPLAGSELGRSLLAFGSTWLTGIDASSDGRLSAAAGEGMRTALLVPVRDGNATIGILELLTRADAPRDTELAAAMEAVALQLGHYWQLIRLSGQPHWRFGRL
jgi:PAS domain S-box-containing protein